MEPIQFEDFVQKHYQYIYNFAYKLACHPDIAKDITQETFLKLWQHHDKIKDDQAIRGWLRSVCLNEFRMLMRKQAHEEIIDVETLEKEASLTKDRKPSQIDELAVREDIKKLRNGCFIAMVRKLTLAQRIAFSLSDMLGLSIQEIAYLMNTTPGAVKGLLYRARMNLDAFFSDHCMFIDVENPCKCQAWLDFASKRDELQSKVKHIKQTTLDYHQKNYETMPDFTPNEDWYDNLVQQINNFMTT